MSRIAQKLLRYILISILTVGVVCSCCSCDIQINSDPTQGSSETSSTPTDQNNISGNVLSISAKPMPDAKSAIDTAMALSSCSNSVIYQYVCDSYSKWLKDNLSDKVITRLQWITKLINQLGLQKNEDTNSNIQEYGDADLFEESEVFVIAAQNNILDPKSSRFQPYKMVTRQYVAYTLVKAIGYKDNYDVSIKDYYMLSDPQEASACVYFDYIKLDDNGNFNPYISITDDEIDSIITEVGKIKELKGKKIVSFGDSIMSGDGNDYVGISDLIAQKYKMNVCDYSVGGAAFGYVKDKSRISDQIKSAISNHESADIVLIDGGTNDMRKCKPGKMSDGFEYTNLDITDFASGMEYALGLIKENYHSVPVLYIRAHNMSFSPEVNELYFGNLALNICNKWNIPFVDMYNDSDFDTDNDIQLRDDYTFYVTKKGKGDSVHPNRLGYMRYYLPMVVDKLIDMEI